MDANQAGPETLIDAIRYFADADVSLHFMAALRWSNGVTCPHCSGIEHSFLKTRRIWKCKGCRKQFSVKVGTVFEDSPIGLDKWLPCIWMLVNCKNGISSYEVSRALGVTQKTAWFMLHRIRLAMQTKSFDKFGGPTEVDETFIGGRSRFMHKEKRERMIKGTGGMGKVAVMGLLERHGENRKHSTVRVSIVPNVRRATLQAAVRANVEAGAEVFSDALQSYEGLSAEYVHGVIDHGEKYVEGQVHTNGLENFWSLLKRSIKGTYVSVQPFHLFRYLDEQTFRFNNRKSNDGWRFIEVVKALAGKRLTYRELIGSDLPQTSPA
jgi:transposase-like protein